MLSRSSGPDGGLNPKLFEEVLFVLRDFQIVLPRPTTTLLRAFVTPDCSSHARPQTNFCTLPEETFREAVMGPGRAETR